MIEIAHFTPTETLPCVSPYVSRLVYFCRWLELPFHLFQQNPLTLRQDSPNGKLPYINLATERLADSALIMARLRPEHAAIRPELERLLEQQLYPYGIIFPRWCHTPGWQNYSNILFDSAPIPADVIPLIHSSIISQFPQLTPLTHTQVLQQLYQLLPELCHWVAQAPNLSLAEQASLAAFIDHLMFSAELTPDFANLRDELMNAQLANLSWPVSA